MERSRRAGVGRARVSAGRVRDAYLGYASQQFRNCRMIQTAIGILASGLLPIRNRPGRCLPLRVRNAFWVGGPGR